MPGSLVQTISFAILALAAQTGTGGAETLSAQLKGWEEVPAIQSFASGTFQATMTTNSIAYTLTYKNFGSSIQAAHIHFGQKGVNGGVMAFLCSSSGSGGAPVCPGPSNGTISSTITAAKIIGPAAQNIQAGQIGRALLAIRTGIAYVDVHSTQFPGGEIRGQIAVAP